MSARPFVYSNLAMTADGKITSATREYPKFTSPGDRRMMDRLRAAADVVVIGAATLRHDDPPMHVRDPDMQALRASLGKPPKLMYAVVTRSLTLSPAARFFTDPHGGHKFIATVDGADGAAFAALGDVDVWRLGREEVDVLALLQRLRERGAEHVLVEGGGDLMWHFVRARALDEVHVTVAPALLGGRDAPTWLEGPGLTMADQVRLELIEAKVEGSDIFCHYRVV